MYIVGEGAIRSVGNEYDGKISKVEPDENKMVPKKDKYPFSGIALVVPGSGAEGMWGGEGSWNGIKAQPGELGGELGIIGNSGKDAFGPLSHKTFNKREAPDFIIYVLGDIGTTGMRGKILIRQPGQDFLEYPFNQIDSTLAGVTKERWYFSPEKGDAATRRPQEKGGNYPDDKEEALYAALANNKELTAIIKYLADRTHGVAPISNALYNEARPIAMATHDRCAWSAISYVLNYDKIDEPITVDNKGGFLSSGGVTGAIMPLATRLLTPRAEFIAPKAQLHTTVSLRIRALHPISFGSTEGGEAAMKEYQRRLELAAEVAKKKEEFDWKLRLKQEAEKEGEILENALKAWSKNNKTNIQSYLRARSARVKKFLHPLVYKSMQELKETLENVLTFETTRRPGGELIRDLNDTISSTDYIIELFKKTEPGSPILEEEEKGASMTLRFIDIENNILGFISSIRSDEHLEGITSTLETARAIDKNNFEGASEEGKNSSFLEEQAAAEATARRWLEPHGSQMMHNVETAAGDAKKLSDKAADDRLRDREAAQEMWKKAFEQASAAAGVSYDRGEIERMAKKKAGEEEEKKRRDRTPLPADPPDVPGSPRTQRERDDDKKGGGKLKRKRYTRKNSKRRTRKQRKQYTKNKRGGQRKQRKLAKKRRHQKKIKAQHKRKTTRKNKYVARGGNRKATRKNRVRRSR